MNKTIMMLDEVARFATSNREIMLFVADKSIVDKFVERYGGERCVGEDGNPFILYEGCKIRYAFSSDKSNEYKSIPFNNIDNLFVAQELESHRSTLQHFKRWGSEIK